MSRLVQRIESLARDGVRVTVKRDPPRVYLRWPSGYGRSIACSPALAAKCGEVAARESRWLR